MTARAYIQPDMLNWHGIAVWLGRSDPGRDEVEVVLPIELVIERQTMMEGAASREPTLRLPDDLARALLDALVQHYGGHQNLRSLRADYDAERKRVDRFIDHLTGRST